MERSERRHFKVVLGLAGLFLLLLWLGAAHFIYSNRQQALLYSQQLVERKTSAVEEQVRRTFRLVEVFLASCRLWIEQHPQADPRSDPRFAAMVREFRESTGGAIDLRLVTEDGGLHDLRRDVEVPPARVGDRDFFGSHAAPGSHELQFGKLFHDPIDRKWKFPVSTALPENRARITVAVAAVGLSALQEMFAHERLMGTTEVALIRRDGMPVARFPDAVDRSGAPAPGGISGADFTRRPRDVRMVGDGAGQSVPRMLVYSSMPDYPLVVLVSVAVPELLAPWRRQATMIVVGAAGISLVALAVVVHLIGLLRTLDSRRREVGRLTSMDMLTGTLNHSMFVETLERDFLRSRRYGQPLTVMMLDIDFFKRINDGYGHSVGDEALRAFAAALKQGLRSVDSIGRLSGEEFAIVLPSTTGEAAALLAERLRGRIAEIALKARRGDEVRFTTSIGVAEMLDSDASAERILTRADAALRRAKSKGRDRVEVELDDGAVGALGTREPAG